MGPNEDDSGKLEVAVHRRGDVVVVSPAGEIDVWSADIVRQALRDLPIAGRPPEVVVDLTAVPFIDSTGIGVLVGALKRLREAGGSMDLVVDSSGTLKMLEITKLDNVFRVFRSLDDALGQDGPRQRAGQA